MLNKQILLIDDERDLMESIAIQCRRVGLGVRMACNSLTTVNQLTEQTPDLICLDVNMPTGNGLDICEYLKSQKFSAEVPVIILTGNKDDKTKYRCKELRAYYIHKSPDLWKRMRPVVEELLDVTLTEEQNQHAQR